MSRLVAVGNLVQAGVLGGLCAWLLPRYGPAAALAGLGCGLQVVAAGMVVAGRPGPARGLAAATLACGLGVIGLFVQAAVHTMIAYGSEATRHGQLALLAVLSAAPWVVGFPLWQWLRGRAPGADALRGAGGVLLALGLAGLPAAARAVTTGPEVRHATASEAQGRVMVEAAWRRWNGQGELPAGQGGPATVLLTPWSEGRPGETVQARGADLADAVQQALERLPAPGPRPALVLDLVEERWPAGTALPPARAAAEGGPSPLTVVQGDRRTTTVTPLPEWRLPAAPGEGPMLRVRSFLAHEGGAEALVNGWAAAPALDADQALAAAVAAGDMLLAHQDADGRYAYIVEGPSGREGPGYNFPRHAGATWFLARLASRTGQERFATAADRGLDHLAAASQRQPDGSAWVRDPRRRDGRAWAGTTALAALGAAERGHPMAGPWGAFLAASIDARGVARGEVVEATATFPEQPVNPYGQGQVTLALAALVRAGQADLRPATERAAAFLDGAYAPLAAARLVVLDEHWTCLAASALLDVTGAAHGMAACHGYLADSALRTPVPRDALAIAAGPAGGLAEAVVAGAFLDPEGPHRARALAFGQHFLDSQYRPGDAPLLPRPQALLGGFRDRPWELDVRMDAVQHIGCALLGVEELLRGERLPGSRP